MRFVLESSRVVECCRSRPRDVDRAEEYRGLDDPVGKFGVRVHLANEKCSANHAANSLANNPQRIGEAPAVVFAHCTLATVSCQLVLEQTSDFDQFRLNGRSWALIGPCSFGPSVVIDRGYDLCGVVRI